MYEMDDFQKHLRGSLRDEAFRAEYEAKELGYKVIDILTGLRIRYKPNCPKSFCCLSPFS